MIILFPSTVTVYQLYIFILDFLYIFIVPFIHEEDAGKRTDFCG